MIDDKTLTAMVARSKDAGSWASKDVPLLVAEIGRWKAVAARNMERGTKAAKHNAALLAEVERLTAENQRQRRIAASAGDECEVCGCDHFRLKAPAVDAFTANGVKRVSPEVEP